MKRSIVLGFQIQKALGAFPTLLRTISAPVHTPIGLSEVYRRKVGLMATAPRRLLNSGQPDHTSS